MTPVRDRARRSAVRAVRSLIATPGVRDGLRWFLRASSIPARWREVAHRKIAKRARFSDAPFEYRTPDGVVLRLVHSGTSNYLYWLGRYEPETTGLFTALARRASVILDIGAADALYALFAAAANPDARILAFEPGDAAAATARRNLALNPTVTGRIELLRVALGERDEAATLYVAGETGGTSSLDPSHRSNRTTEVVSVRTGDRVLAERSIDRVDLIKIDTESTEPAVLRGLARTLEQHHPDVICEVLAGRTERELERQLQPLGYRFLWVTFDGLVEHATLSGDPTYRQPNYLFTTKSDAELQRLGIAGPEAPRSTGEGRAKLVIT